MTIEADATIFHSLIKQFEKLSKLKLNPMKLAAYVTPCAKNRVIQDWTFPINLTTGSTFFTIVSTQRIKLDNKTEGYFEEDTATMRQGARTHYIKACV
ncbi:unnamed protein product [Ambrosiozyma monospora]|uniref:Unnamed protein product n=1 Tax=Ambrosiozyma monospora TaxID=43982 RepID=A0A9W7DM96_AMBMO|nr:unnamed protein product [Ambrosiozyma monospora]